MKVICVDNNYVLFNHLATAPLLTIGKEYKVKGFTHFPNLFGSAKLEKHDEYLILLDDNSKIVIWYPTHLFMTLNEYRNKKLEELGI
jgi:hypothetical protein